MDELAPLTGSIEQHAAVLASAFGYTYGVLTDGTIILEPPPDPDCCGTCAAQPRTG